MTHPELKFELGEMTGVFFKDPKTGNIFELAIARQLQADEIARREAESKADAKKERSERMQHIGDVLATLFGDLADAASGDNGEPECLMCGNHHEGAFTSLSVLFETREPYAETTTRDYTDVGTAMNDVEGQVRMLEARLGVKLHEGKMKDLTPDLDHDDPTGIQKFEQHYVTGNGRSATVVMRLEFAFQRQPAKTQLN